MQTISRNHVIGNVIAPYGVRGRVMATHPCNKRGFHPGSGGFVLFKNVKVSSKCVLPLPTTLFCVPETLYESTQILVFCGGCLAMG